MLKKQSIYSVFLIAFILFAVHAFAGGKKDSKVQSQPSIKDYQSKANAVVVSADAVSFVDGTGASRTLKKQQGRVVGLFTSHNVLWYEAGGSLVGRVGGKSAEEQLPQAAKQPEIVIVGESSAAKRVSIETVLAQKPDLVILGTAMDQPSLATVFNQTGVNTLIVDYEDFGDYLKWFKIFANLNNKPELYEKVALQTLQSVNGVLTKVPVEKKPKVLILFGGPSKFKANLSSSTFGGMVADMGAVNIADGLGTPDGAGKIDINVESMLAAQPDLILVQCHADTKEIENLVQNNYGNNPAWNALNAVKAGKVYYLPKELFHYKANSRYSEAYQMLGEILYPEVFTKQ